MKSPGGQRHAGYSMHVENAVWERSRNRPWCSRRSRHPASRDTSDRRESPWDTSMYVAGLAIRHLLLHCSRQLLLRYSTSPILRLVPRASGNCSCIALPRASMPSPWPGIRIGSTCDSTHVESAVWERSRNRPWWSAPGLAIRQLLLHCPTSGIPGLALRVHSEPLGMRFNACRKRGLGEKQEPSLVECTRPAHSATAPALLYLAHPWARPARAFGAARHAIQRMPKTRLLIPPGV